MEVSPNSTTQPLNMYDYINNYFSDPIMLSILVIIIITFLVMSMYLGNISGNETNNVVDSDENNATKFYGTIGIILFAVLILINGTQYFLGVNFYASVKNIFYGIPEVDIKVVPEIGSATKNTILSEISEEFDQVFNVPGNHYNYNDSKAICSAYGGRLATYNEIERAYNDGAEWCNYGWSDGQMALYPTQKNTYDNLQKIKGHEHNCGRAGVNGGYIANPLVKFGVNCYGHKPKINQQEQHLMDVTTPYPKTKEDLLFEQKVSYWRNNLDKILLSPFSYSSWNKT